MSPNLSALGGVGRRPKVCRRASTIAAAASRGDERYYRRGGTKVLVQNAPQQTLDTPSDPVVQWFTMKRRSLALPEDLYRRLNDESERTGAPVAWQVRRALTRAFPPIAEDDEMNLRTEANPEPADKPKPKVEKP